MQVKRKSYYDQAINKIIKGSENGFNKGSEIMLDATKKAVGGSGNVAKTIELQKNKASNGFINKIFSINIATWVLQRGSGQYAEEGKHVGKSKAFIRSGYKFWYVPKSLADLSKYNYPRIVTNNGDILFLVRGQRPKHIFNTGYDATKDTLLKEIKNKIESELKK